MSHTLSHPAIDQLPREPRALVYAARTDGATIDQLRTILAADVDWDRFVQLARRNAVGPLVYRTIAEHCPELLPEDVRSTLQSDAQQLATHGLRYTRELGVVLDALEDAGVDAIPYRGPVLANDAYGDLGLRPFSDLDVLVRPDELPVAREALRDCGYEPESLRPGSGPRSATQERRFLRLCRDYPLSNPERNTAVELHWRVLDLRFPTQIDLETVFDRRSSTTIGGREVPVFGPEDRLLAMCVHGTRHQWERLRWVCDVAEFCRQQTIDWTTTLARAQSHNAERMFLLGVRTAHGLFGTELPEELHRRIDADERLDDLYEQVWEIMFGDEIQGMLDRQRFQARALERHRDRARLLSSWAFKPRGYEIERFDVPDWLSPAYYVYRPVRLLGLSTGLVEPPAVDGHG